jgi:4a-hydroxytetrahydrobiopterin dehydratase
MPDRPARLAADEVTEGIRSLTGWTGDADGIERTIECASFPAAIVLVGRVADVAEQMDHHPDIDIRWRTLRFALSTHSAGGVTALDLDLAARIDALATGGDG